MSWNKEQIQSQIDSIAEDGVIEAVGGRDRSDSEDGEVSFKFADLDLVKGTAEEKDMVGILLMSDSTESKVASVVVPGLIDLEKTPVEVDAMIFMDITKIGGQTHGVKPLLVHGRLCLVSDVPLPTGVATEFVREMLERAVSNVVRATLLLRFWAWVRKCRDCMDEEDVKKLAESRLELIDAFTKRSVKKAAPAWVV